MLPFALLDSQNSQGPRRAEPDANGNQVPNRNDTANGNPTPVTASDLVGNGDRVELEVNGNPVSNRSDLANRNPTQVANSDLVENSDPVAEESTRRPHRAITAPKRLNMDPALKSYA